MSHKFLKKRAFVTMPGCAIPDPTGYWNKSSQKMLMYTSNARRNSHPTEAYGGIKV
jgi:hypothetical protein